MDDGKDTYTMDNEKRQRNFTGLMNGERSSQEPLLLLSHTPSGPAYASCHYDGLASSRFSPSRHGKRDGENLLMFGSLSLSDNGMSDLNSIPASDNIFAYLSCVITSHVMLHIIEPVDFYSFKS